MKRLGVVIQGIASYENILDAFHKAAEGKRNRSDVKSFATRLEENFQSLSNLLLQGELPKGHYRKFTIYETKERVISVAPFSHRVAYHAIMNYCGDFF